MDCPWKLIVVKANKEKSISLSRFLNEKCLKLAGAAHLRVNLICSTL